MTSNRHSGDVVVSRVGHVITTTNSDLNYIISADGTFETVDSCPLAAVVAPGDVGVAVVVVKSQRCQ